MHCSRMGSLELYKPLNWKVVLDGSGVFGSGRHTVLQRWTLEYASFIWHSVVHVQELLWFFFNFTSLVHSFGILLFQKIYEQNGGRYEMVVYALQCSNLKLILPVCTDWEVCCDLGYFFLWLLVRDPSFSFLFLVSLLGTVKILARWTSGSRVISIPNQ